MKQLLLMYAGIALTALCWGSYGIILHKGQALLGGDRLKPLICVGFAYFIVAIILPAAFLVSQGKLGGDWTFLGVVWSMGAGTAGALGALGIILALSSNGKPHIVMPMVFGFAPIITAFAYIYLSNLWSEASPQFYTGIILVVVGALTVQMTAPKAKPQATKSETHTEEHEAQGNTDIPEVFKDEASTE
ncbi:MAG: hypothetical protein COA78_11090 [Blastopirellula sp.]|nr:MAG: hypothetical protein COA78_11090 [Blastopirellula sp.]